MKFYSFDCDEKLPITTALIETADKDFFAMIDEETQHRLKELEEQERLKQIAVKAQFESAEEATQEQSDSDHNGSAHINEVTNGLHENGHAENQEEAEEEENGRADDEQ